MCFCVVGVCVFPWWAHVNFTRDHLFFVRRPTCKKHKLLLLEPSVFSHVVSCFLHTWSCAFHTRGHVLSTHKCCRACRLWAAIICCYGLHCRARPPPQHTQLFASPPQHLFVSHVRRWQQAPQAAAHHGAIPVWRQVVRVYAPPWPWRNGARAGTGRARSVRPLVFFTGGSSEKKQVVACGIHMRPPRKNTYAYHKKTHEGAM